MTTYRQIARALKLSYGPGRPRVESVRPHTKGEDGTITYLDSDDEPTLVEITGTEVGLNLEVLLAAGAVVPHEAAGEGG